MKERVSITFASLALLALASAAGCTGRPAAGGTESTAQPPAAAATPAPAAPERVVTRSLGEDSGGVFCKEVEVVRDGDAVTTTTTTRLRSANAWVSRVVVEAHKGGKKTASATETINHDDGTT